MTLAPPDLGRGALRAAHGRDDRALGDSLFPGKLLLSIISWRLRGSAPGLAGISPTAGPGGLNIPRLRCRAAPGAQSYHPASSDTKTPAGPARESCGRGLRADRGTGDPHRSPLLSWIGERAVFFLRTCQLMACWQPKIIRGRNPTYTLQIRDQNGMGHPHFLPCTWAGNVTCDISESWEKKGLLQPMGAAGRPLRLRSG